MTTRNISTFLFSLMILLTAAWSFTDQLASGRLAFAEDDSAADEKSADEKSATEDDEANSSAELSDEDALARWKELITRRNDIAGQLVKLNLDFKKAGADEQKKIREDYTALINEFKNDVQPGMIDLAERVASLDPDDADAVEIAITLIWNKNQYPQIVEWAKKLYDSGRKTKTVLNYGGVALFATHDFETAAKWLTEADAELLLDPTIGGRYLQDANEYVEFWKAEQAIREKEENAPEAEQLPRVLFKTSKGEILIELFENEAPNTVANFISLVESKTYDGVSFHRVIPNFMVQSGDPNSKDADPDNDGQGGPGYTIDCECYASNARKHFSGSLSMAHRGKDTGGSQFFVTHLPTSHLNTNVELKRGHTVFGRVIEGLEIVRAIEQGDLIDEATVVRKRDHEYVPVKN